MASKVKKVKWALGGSEPEDLQEFKDNEQIIKENKGELPPKGIYKFLVRMIGVKPNKNGDDRLNIMLVLDEPKKSKVSSWNGLVVWEGFNVTEQGSPFIKRWLKSMGLEWDDFISKSQEEVDGDKRRIVRIGKHKFGQDADKKVVIDALTKNKPADDYNDSEHVEIQRFIPKDADNDSSKDDDSSSAPVEMGGDEPDDGKEVITIDSLKKMKPKALKEHALAAGIKQKKIDALDKDGLVDAITKKLNLAPF